MLQIRFIFRGEEIYEKNDPHFLLRNLFWQIVHSYPCFIKKNCPAFKLCPLYIHFNVFINQWTIANILKLDLTTNKLNTFREQANTLAINDKHKKRYKCKKKNSVVMSLNKAEQDHKTIRIRFHSFLASAGETKYLITKHKITLFY